MDGEMVVPAASDEPYTPSKTPGRHSSRVSLPMSPTSPLQPLVCCSRPKGRYWVAEPRSGTVLATLKVRRVCAAALAP